MWTGWWGSEPPPVSGQRFSTRDAPLPSAGSRRARFPVLLGTMRALRLPARANPFPYVFGRGLHMLPCLRARRGAPGAAGDHIQAWALWSAGCPSPASCTWARTGSLRFPGGPSHTSARLSDPGRIDRTSPLPVLPMLPPVPTHRRLPREVISGLNPELWYLLPTLHEQRCRYPCKARFRLVGCTFTGRESNPLGRFERFQATTILLSRTLPDANGIHTYISV